MNKPINSIFYSQCGGAMHIQSLLKKINVLSCIISIFAVLFILIVISACLFGFSELTDSWANQAKLVAPDGVEYSYFGKSIAITNDYAFVASSSVLESDYDGGIYIYKRDNNTWHYNAKLTDLEGSNAYGHPFCVAVHEDTLVIGYRVSYNIEHFHDGALFVCNLVKDKWTYSQKIHFPDNNSDWPFYEVDIYKNKIIAGTGGASNRAYIFSNDKGVWSLEGTLVPSDIMPGDEFGLSVGISGKYAIVGAPFSGNKKGAVYVFKRKGNTWKHISKLQPINKSNNAYTLFGLNSAISDNCIIASANYKLNRVVIVYNIVGNKVKQKAVLSAPKYDKRKIYFAGSVAIEGKTLIVGSGRKYWYVSKSTAYIYILDNDKWTLQSTIQDNDIYDGRDGDSFGCNVAIADDYIIVGDVYDSQYGEDQGAAYIFARQVETGISY